jgi:signal transduction histidine kinase/HPt (histidine-containing phosphotransfer) domain-containing protein
MDINNKILIVDDNPSIHQDFKNALEIRSSIQSDKVLKLEKEIFGKNSGQKTTQIQFDLQHALSTEESLILLAQKQNIDTPIAVIFMDIKMPPGMDGISASKLILEKYPHTEIVLCTAFTEFTHEEILEKLGLTDHILFLKKPFDIVEVRQLAIALVQKWNLNREVEQYTNNLELEVSKRTKDLEDALVQVKKSDLAKSNFLSLMSHEIRNPINSIVGLIDLMQKCSDQKEKDNYIHLTQKASATLLELVNDILDLSKIEANKLVIENVQINLPQILEQLISLFSLPLSQKGIHLCSLHSLDLPEKIYGDQMRIKQILMNFLTNASKFTLNGSITLNLEYKRINTKKGLFKFKVIDTGIGISEKDQSKIFSDYTQISEGIPYNILGTGLGLSITRKLATLMGGDVGVQSKKNKGSTFWLELPMTISKNDISYLDKTRISKNIKLLIVACSESTNAFFSHYSKEFEIKKNCTLISDKNDTPRTLNSMPENIGTLHVFFEIENSIPGKMLVESIKKSKYKIVFHPIVPHLQNQNISLTNEVSLIPMTRPLQLSELYNQIADTSIKDSKNPEIYSDNIDSELLKKINKIKILIVDDDAMSLLITSTNLKKFGFNVDQAESGELAIQYHKKFKYDLIFMDLMLNGSNGIEATQTIRRLTPPLNKVHVIALTANAFVEDKERCLLGGMNDFLTKPLSPNTLYEVVMSFILKIYNTNDSITAIPTTAIAEEESIKAQISTNLSNMYGFKEDQIQKIVATSRTSLSDTLKEIEIALIEKNNHLLKILFHRMKGSLNNIGLKESSEWARAIELDIMERNDISNALQALQKLKKFLHSFISN